VCAERLVEAVLLEPRLLPQLPRGRQRTFDSFRAGGAHSV